VNIRVHACIHASLGMVVVARIVKDATFSLVAECSVVMNSFRIRIALFAAGI
jgi:hypothetical protein